MLTGARNFKRPVLGRTRWSRISSAPKAPSSAPAPTRTTQQQCEVVEVVDDVVKLEFDKTEVPSNDVSLPTSTIVLWSPTPSKSSRPPSQLLLTMPNQIKDLHTVDTTSFPYTFEQNATIKLSSGRGLVRCNVYRPKESGDQLKVPVIVTYGPYGKDIHYQE